MKTDYVTYYQSYSNQNLIAPEKKRPRMEKSESNQFIQAIQIFAPKDCKPALKNSSMGTNQIPVSDY